LFNSIDFETNLRSYQCCKRFATASTSRQVAVLPWRYVAKTGTTNSLHS